MTRAGWIVVLAVMALCAVAPAQPKNEVRLGYFPNITHAQALIGVARGDFKKALGTDADLKTMTFNAGPSVIEAIFAGHLDIAYVGPSPTLNGFMQSKGEEIRVIAGAAENGVLVVGNAKRGFKSLQELRGKKIASPQLGNTQDISAKYFVVHDLKSNLKERGGDTEVIPIQNPDIEILFAKDQLDAAWVPEPWGSRLVNNGLGNIIGEEKDLWPSKRFTLTNIIARKKFLEEHPDLIEKILEAHATITHELQQSPMQFTTIINQELKRLTTKDLPQAVIEGSLKHVAFTTDPSPESFSRFFDMGRELKFIRDDKLDLTKLIDSRLLQQAVKKVGNDNGTSAPVTRP